MPVEDYSITSFILSLENIMCSGGRWQLHRLVISEAVAYITDPYHAKQRGDCGHRVPGLNTRRLSLSLFLSLSLPCWMDMSREM